MVDNVIISVTTNSNTLPNKCLLKFGDGNVLEHIIRRVKFFKFEPIICTTEKTQDNVIIDIARKEEVKCFRGNLDNKYELFSECCNKYDIDNFHSIGIDYPFFDDNLIKQSIRWLGKKRVDAVYPTKFSLNGGASVGYSFTKDIMLKACTLSEVNKVPGFRFARLKNYYNPPKSRLALDYIEDYILLSAIEKLVGTYASREVVDLLLRRNPDMYRINWFRNIKNKRGFVNG